MRRRQARLATLLLGTLLLTLFCGTARADQGRAVGYVLSFQLGVDQELATELMGKLSEETSKWHNNASPLGEPVPRDCASSKKCVRQAGAALGVTRLGMVAIVAAAGVVRLDVRLVDTQTGKELLRTHAEYEISAGAAAAQRALFDLMPRLLPGEKAVVVPAVDTPPENVIKDESEVIVPPVSQIPAESPPRDLGLEQEHERPAESGTRWWLWGGLGVAAAATAVAVVLLIPEDNPDRAVLELPPAR